MKWGLQRVARFQKSPKLGMEKKKSEKSIKNVARERARLSEKHWHFGSNLERQQCDTWYDWLASGLGKKPFPRAKLEWQMNKSAH